MLSDHEQLFQEYDLAQLANSIVREYLIKNGYRQASKIFENECGQKLVKKSILLKMLSLTTIFQEDKKSDDPQPSILQLIIHYLKNKYAKRKAKHAENNTNQISLKINQIQQIRQMEQKNPQSRANFENAERDSKQQSKRQKQNIQLELKEHQELSQSHRSNRLKIIPTSTQNNPNQKAEGESATKSKIINIGKKKKDNTKQVEKPKQQPKFVFDDNFVDEPLRVQTPTYAYQEFELAKMVISEKDKLQFPIPSIDYEHLPSFKDKQSIRKKNESNLSKVETDRLKKVMFQKGSSALSSAWRQGFILSQYPGTPYGLIQMEGGPCGIIAAVQCYFLKHLLYCSKPKSEEDLHKNQKREICLVAAITDLLMKVKSGENIRLLTAPLLVNTQKLNFQGLIITELQAPNFSVAFEGIYRNRSSFIGKSNRGVELLVYSTVLTHGIQNIELEIDTIENPLIGNHGHCTQELLNLFLTGKAVSNCFNNNMEVEFVQLRGIEDTSQFGFLTVSEVLNYMKVGSYLKTPTFPIWIVCKDFHYHVIFANHYLVSKDEQAKKFDIIYFDGLYNAADRIRITGVYSNAQRQAKDLPLIERVMLTKWKSTSFDWNGHAEIL